MSFLQNFSPDLKLGNFEEEDPFYHWEYNRIMTIKSVKNRPWKQTFVEMYETDYIIVSRYGTLKSYKYEFFRIIIISYFIMHFFTLCKACK